MLYYYTNILNDLIRNTALLMTIVIRIRLSHVKMTYFNFKTVIVKYTCVKNLCNHIDIKKINFCVSKKELLPRM